MSFFLSYHSHLLTVSILIEKHLHLEHVHVLDIVFGHGSYTVRLGHHENVPI